MRPEFRHSCLCPRGDQVDHGDDAGMELWSNSRGLKADGFERSRGGQARPNQAQTAEGLCQDFFACRRSLSRVWLADDMWQVSQTRPSTSASRPPLIRSPKWGWPAQAQHLGTEAWTQSSFAVPCSTPITKHRLVAFPNHNPEHQQQLEPMRNSACLGFAVARRPFANIYSRKVCHSWTNVV